MPLGCGFGWYRYWALLGCTRLRFLCFQGAVFEMRGLQGLRSFALGAFFVALGMGAALLGDRVQGLPISPKVVPFAGSYLEFYNYKVIPKRNYFGAYG